VCPDLTVPLPAVSSLGSASKPPDPIAGCDTTKTGEDERFLAPPWLPRPTWILFFLKATFIVAAYIGYVLPLLVKKFVA
jgi:hypothetical protein